MSEFEHDLIRADKRARAVTIATIIGMMLLGSIVIPLTMSYLSELDEQLDKVPPEKAISKAKAVIRCLTAIVSVSTVCMGIYIAHFGNRIRRSCQSPPPGTRVIRDTRPIKGKRARLLGGVVVILGALIAVCGVGFFLWVWALVESLMNKMPPAAGA